MTSRQQYITKTLGLDHDPFQHAVAEKEIQVRPEFPPFFNYYVHPPSYQVIDGQEQELTKPLVECLRRAEHALVAADAGEGKTTTRYALESDSRRIPENTLVVSYEIGKGATIAVNPAIVRQQLAQDWAIDLLVRVEEQFDTLNIPHERDEIRELALYWQSNIPEFKRKLRRDLDKSATSQVLGISSHWYKTWQRPAMRFVELTPPLKKFLELLLDTEVAPQHSTKPLLSAVNWAMRLGFQQCFLLVDIAGDQGEEQGKLLQHLDTLFNALPQPSALPIYVKCFAPSDLAEPIQSLMEKHLQPKLFSAIIKWTDDALQAMIENRFRSAKGRFKHFNALTSHKFNESLDSLIIRSADGSPRRLLRIVSQLINSHADRASNVPGISVADWQEMRDSWASTKKPVPISNN